MIKTNTVSGFSPEGSKPLPVYINGRFLNRPVTGVERFAREIVRALDEERATQPEEALPITLLAPQGTPTPEGLKHIEFRTCGTHQGHLWEQGDLWRASRDGLLLSLTNSGPVLHSNHLVVIHDALVYHFSKSVSFVYGLFHRTLGWLLARRAQIATVSCFSREELAEVFRLDPEKIPVVSNGHEHILRIQPDDAIFKKLDLCGRPYFLFVGSPAPNKNLRCALEAYLALRRDDVCLVAVGVASAAILKSGLHEKPFNVLTPGRLSDGEIVALYRHALALVFPSLYEGFGIPPLEAMTLGCPVIASRISPVQEVCAEAALFFSPLDINGIMGGMEKILDSDTLRQELIAKGHARCRHFSWKKSAAVLRRSLIAMGA